MARLLLNTSDYILDSADSGSTSTTSGVQLLLDDAASGEPFRPVITNNEFRWPIMFARVTAASEAACKTAVEAVVNALRNCSGKSITYQETSGTALFAMPNTLWPEAEAEIEIDQADLTADIAFTFIGRNGGQVSSGSADPAGLLAPIQWQYEITGGGIAGMVAVAAFGPTLNGSGVITAGARQNAVAWINHIRNTSNYPAWLSTAFRDVQAVIEFDQKQNQATIGESSYDPALVTIAFRELPATLAADGSFPATCKSVNYETFMVERPPINQRSGQTTPGFDFEVVGSLVLKTEGNLTFNGSESSLADNAIVAAADAAIASVITMFRAIHADRALIQLGRHQFTGLDPVQGVCSFKIRFTTSEPIKRWEESCQLQNTPIKAWSRASRGADWKYQAKGGPIRTITHTLSIDSLNGPQNYRPPGLGPNWDDSGSVDEPSFGVTYDNGVAIYTVSYSRSWRYVNPGDGDNGAGRATVTGAPRTVDTVGSAQGVI